MKKATRPGPAAQTGDLAGEPAVRKTIVWFGLVTIGVALFALFLASRPARSIDVAQIVRAVQQFRANHSPPPPTVTFSELIARGYLGSNMLQQFGASEVTVHLQGMDTNPQGFFMDAQLRDGSHLRLLSDGSVQEFSRGPSVPGASNTVQAPAGAQ